MKKEKAEKRRAEQALKAQAPFLKGSKGPREARASVKEEKEGPARREVHVTIQERPAAVAPKPARPSLLDEVAALAVSSMRKSEGRMSLGPRVLEERRSCGEHVNSVHFGGAREVRDPKFIAFFDTFAVVSCRTESGRMTVGARQTLDPSLRAGLLALRAEMAKEKLVEKEELKVEELKVDEKAAPLVPDKLQEVEPMKLHAFEKELRVREVEEKEVEKVEKKLESLLPEGRMSMGRMSLGRSALLAAEAVDEARESLAQALRQAKQGRAAELPVREQQGQEEIEPVSLEPRESLANKFREAGAFGGWRKCVGPHFPYHIMISICIV